MTSKSTSLRGARVAFTGVLASMTRREAFGAVRRQGGVPVSTVSRRTAVLVVGARGLPVQRDGRATSALERAEQFKRNGAPLRIVPEETFLEMIGLRAPEQLSGKSYPLEEVAGLVGAEPSTIERWEHLGLIRSHDGLYDFRDIVSLQGIAALIRGGARPEAIRRSLHGLSHALPGVEQPLAQLHIVVAGPDELLAQIGTTLIAPDGQQHFDFFGAADDRSATETIDAIAPQTADEWLDRAMRCEEEERFDDAAAACRRAIALDPGSSEAYFNLGNALRAAGRFEAAEEMFLIALEMDPDGAHAWYNLADVQEESGRLDQAITCLLRAIELNPDFADAHFNLAGCLEQVGALEEARVHWRAYLRSDPDSEWAAIAREHLADPVEKSP
jgi:tetratricopeptide (TPR) repeat protein